MQSICYWYHQQPETFFRQGMRGAENIKFRLFPKLPIICINADMFIGSRALHILLLLNLNEGLGVEPLALGDF